MPRSRSGAFGRRRPRTGTEPVTAQSAVRLRRLLAALFLPLFAAAAVLFAVLAAEAEPGDALDRGDLVVLAVMCGVFALLAAVNLWVLGRRLRRERGDGPT
ncbi:DUF6343 family protein [Streptomyces sp. NPDC005925]|uniref:DUF6343 family protein n=1 Tax=Streptomyces sp. NPDC005925 TaxID=3157172 RepID=UPI0033EE838D